MINTSNDSTPLPLRVCGAGAGIKTEKENLEQPHALPYVESETLPTSGAQLASGNGLASLAEAVKTWRKAEKRHALMVLGELGGDSDEAKDIADRKLHVVRIVADKIEAMPST